MELKLEVLGLELEAVDSEPDALQLNFEALESEQEAHDCAN